MEKQVETLLPTKWGNFRMIAYSDSKEETMPHLAMVNEKCDVSRPVLVRIHSECLTGDLFGSKRCDCGEQLDVALSLAAKDGGIVLYLRQEGRGIGIINKMKAYNIQDQGVNTVDANTHLGLEVDARRYDIAIRMLEELGVSKIRLLTNNPLKIEAIKNSSIEIIDRVPLIIKPIKENKGYMETKRDIMGHLYNNL